MIDDNLPPWKEVEEALEEAETLEEAEAQEGEELALQVEYIILFLQG